MPPQAAHLVKGRGCGVHGCILDGRGWIVNGICRTAGGSGDETNDGLGLLEGTNDEGLCAVTVVRIARAAGSGILAKETGDLIIDEDENGNCQRRASSTLSLPKQANFNRSTPAYTDKHDTKVLQELEGRTMVCRRSSCKVRR